MRLFISYARVDKPLCKQIVHYLEEIHEVWYDKRLHAGQEWWREIQERLAWCEGFVYLLSPESVASEYCQKEYAIAIQDGKDIFPVLIQAQTNIPEGLQHIHYADLSQGMEDVITLMNALTLAERRLKEQPTQRKKSESVHPIVTDSAPSISPNQSLAQAADALDAHHYDHAVFLLKQALTKQPVGNIARMLKAMLTDAETALENQIYLREAERDYAPIRELVKRQATRALGCAEFSEFQAAFPNYDPDNLLHSCKELAPLSTKQLTVNLLKILPTPFEWVDIPSGKVRLVTKEGWRENYIQKGNPQTFDVPAFKIAKYPVTNAQFAPFVEEGYREMKWWTDAGWNALQQGWVWNNKKSEWQVSNQAWTQPRYWKDNNWNGVEQPVVGVSWYEAIAYCRWLSAQTGQTITLPTEQQWQFAASGHQGLAYPWGNDWNPDRCNNNIGGKGRGKTTPVKEYEGKGDSPFGVVDMGGNVWEWCLTEYETGINSISGTNIRVLRGGSWYSGNTGNFLCDYRFGGTPHGRHGGRGFRPALS